MTVRFCDNCGYRGEFLYVHPLNGSRDYEECPGCGCIYGTSPEMNAIGHDRDVEFR